MIDFQLTPTDEKVLSSAHEQAIIGQRYARYYDKHEDELEPEEFPEAKDLPNPVMLAEEGIGGSSGARILHSLVMLEIYWGGISLHRSRWGLGNTVLKTVATPEQFEKFKNLTIAIAIPNPAPALTPRTFERLRLSIARPANGFSTARKSLSRRRNPPTPRWSSRALSRRTEAAA